jgi:hypothetical protein
MGLSKGISANMVIDTVNEDDLSYLYKFYNLAAYKNFHGGFDSVDAKEAFTNLYESIKTLTDAETSSLAESTAIAMYSAAIQSIAEPRVISTPKGTTVNGVSVWGYFGSLYFNLTQGYISKAGFSTGKMLLELNKPRKNVTGTYQDDIVPTAFAIGHARDFLSDFLLAFSGHSGGRVLAASCTSDDSELNSAKVITSLSTGNWLSAMYYSTAAICTFAAHIECADSVDLPGDIDEMCIVLQQWPEFLLVPEEYRYEYEEENLYPSLIKAANSIYAGEVEELADFVQDAAEEMGGCMKVFLETYMSGYVLMLSVAVLVTTA